MVALVATAGLGIAASACIDPVEQDDSHLYEWEDEDGDKSFGMPPWLSPQKLSVWFTIPPNTWLYKSALVDVYTTRQERLVMSASLDSLTIDAPLFIDVLGPINEELDEVRYDFATGVVTVTFRSSEFGGLNWQSTIQTKLQELVTNTVQGTRMAARGYNPATDSNISETLSSIAGGFLGDAQSGRSGPLFDLTQADQLGVQATFLLTEDKNVNETGTDGVRLLKDHYLQIESSNAFQWPEGSNLQAVIDATTPTEIIAALGIDALSLRSYQLDQYDRPAAGTGIMVISKGKPVALLQDVKIDGDAIELHKWFLAGPALNAAITEKIFLGLFFGKDPETAEARATSKGGIIKGLVSHKLENGLSVALRRLIYKHRDVITGIDLPQALRMTPPPPKQN